MKKELNKSGQRDAFRILAVIYILFIGIVLVMVNTPFGFLPAGEFDDYSLPIASLLNGRLSVCPEDLVTYKAIFPEWADYIDEVYHLSGHYSVTGGEMTFYFPYYAMFCLPIVLLLKGLGISAIYAFPLCNTLLLVASLLMVWLFLATNSQKKLLLILLLSINPIVFYIGWTSGEVLIYSAIVCSMVWWFNKRYCIAAAFIALAGALNPTALLIGMIMTISALRDAVKRNEKLLDTIKYLVQYVLSYFPVLVVFGYNLINMGHLNIVVSHSNTYINPNDDTLFDRFFAYLFDLNFGIFPYFGIVFLVAVILTLFAVYKRQWRCPLFMLAFFATILGYSVMMHINSGMSGIARYNAWISPLMMFAIIAFFEESPLNKLLLKRIASISVSLSLIWCGGVIYLYGPYRACNTSYIHMLPIAQAVLDSFPAIYNPLYSTFNSRVNHVDGGYELETPILYYDNNFDIRKILASKADIGELQGSLLGASDDEAWLLAQLEHLGDHPEYISVPKTISLSIYKSYTLGETIHFDTMNGDAADRFVLCGLSYPERGYTWTLGDTVTMHFYMGKSAAPLHVTLVLAGAYGVQEIHIKANNSSIGDYKVSGPCSIEFDCPNSQIDGLLEIQIELPDAHSPLSVQESPDSRVLGLQLKTLTIQQLTHT